MKKLLMYSLFICFLFNCSSRDEEIVEEAHILPLKTTLRSTTTDYVLSSFFTYKNNNEIINITTLDNNNVTIHKEVFTYDKDNISKIEFYEYNNLVKTSEFFYDNSVVIKNIITYNDGHKNHFLYNWLSNNHLVLKKKETESYEDFNYYFSNGNLTKYIYKYNSNMYNNFGETTYNYEYNKSPNVYSNIKGYDKIFIFETFSSKDNIKTIAGLISQTTNGNTSNKTSQDDYSYEYYSSGYPKKQTEISTNQEGEITSYVREYQYNK
jgi:uncharacterized protein YcfL